MLLVVSYACLNATRPLAGFMFYALLVRLYEQLLVVYKVVSKIYGLSNFLYVTYAIYQHVLGFIDDKHKSHSCGLEITKFCPKIAGLSPYQYLHQGHTYKIR